MTRRQQRHRWIGCSTIVRPCSSRVKVIGHASLPGRCANKAARNSYSAVPTRPPLSCPGAPGQDRGGRVGTAEYEFRAALFAHLPGKLACPITFTLDEHGRTMVEQPIQRCRCCRRVTEDRSPFSWHFITGHNDAFLFVACRYQLKKQLSLQRRERDVPQLIGNEQFRLVNIPYFSSKVPAL